MNKHSLVLQRCVTAATLAMQVALATGTSSSFAQSSVQLYGQVDEWVGAQKLPGNANTWAVSGGGMSTSYWGMKGAEDLGGHYRAIFTLEGFFLAQNGQAGRFQGDTFFSRDAYVGIESPYGTLTAGRQTTALFVSTILFNPFADSYVFSPMINHVYLGLGTGPAYTTDQGAIGDSGWSNAVQYATPDLNGLSGNAMYAFGNGAGENGSKRWSLQALYFNGPFAATGVYQYSNFNNNPEDLGQLVPGMRSQSVGQLGLSYDLKFVKFFGQYMFTSNDRTGSNWHVNTAQAGASVPAGPGSVLASYAWSRDSGGLDQTRRTWAIGYDYALSKRSDIYAAYMNDHFTGQSGGDTYGVGLRTKF
jgi:predicted porin